jgi:hypothetical protein
MHHNYVRDADKYKKNMVFLFYLIGKIKCREIKNCKKEIKILVNMCLKFYPPPHKVNNIWTKKSPKPTTLYLKVLHVKENIH